MPPEQEARSTLPRFYSPSRSAVNPRLSIVSNSWTPRYAVSSSLARALSARPRDKYHNLAKHADVSPPTTAHPPTHPPPPPTHPPTPSLSLPLPQNGHGTKHKNDDQAKKAYATVARTFCRACHVFSEAFPCPSPAFYTHSLSFFPSLLGLCWTSWWPSLSDLSL